MFDASCSTCVSLNGTNPQVRIKFQKVKVGGSTICCVIHKLIKYILNKEELREQWKDLIVLPVCKKHYKTECSNFCGVSLLSSAHKIPSNILLSMLTSYAEVKCCGSWM